jgi:hypothetical protein
MGIRLPCQLTKQPKSNIGHTQERVVGITDLTTQKHATSVIGTLTRHIPRPSPTFLHSLPLPVSLMTPKTDAHWS